MRLVIYRLMILLGIIVFFSCTHKEEYVEGVGVDDTQLIRVSATVPQVKSMNLVDPTRSYIFAYDFNSKEETEMIDIYPDKIKDQIYYYTLPPHTECVLFSNCNSGWNDYYMTATKDFETKSLVFSRNYYFPHNDLVAGGAYLSEVDENGLLKVHLKRLISFVSATLKFIDKDDNELPFSDYASSVALAVPGQAKTVTYDVDGNVTISEEVLDRYDLDYFNTAAICSDMPIFPTAYGMNGTIQLRMKHSNNTETILTKQLDYPLEMNKHYVFTITVRRNDTAFDGFVIEDIISETIDIPLN